MNPTDANMLYNDWEVIEFPISTKEKINDDEKLQNLPQMYSDSTSSTPSENVSASCSSSPSNIDTRMMSVVENTKAQFLVQSTELPKAFKLDESEVKVVASNPICRTESPLTEKTLLQKLEEIRKHEGSIPVPADLRIDLFKTLLVVNPKLPERVPSKILREIYDLDLQFIRYALRNEWKTKTEEAEKALKNIYVFLSTNAPSEEMTFFEHSYYCFCFSSLMSGIEVCDLEKEYDTQMHTMLKGVVHPIGKWTPKTELEDQKYAKYICDVSSTGLASIPSMNHLASFRVNQESPFCGVRLMAVACAENVGFDGIEDSGSLKVFKHDFIHAGFLKYAMQTNPKRFWDCMEKIGVMIESINADPNIPEGSLLRAQVEGAFFMWTHELTTSVFVHGWPRRFPKKQILLGGQYASVPQMLLRWSAKFKIIPGIFAKEINNEAEMLQSLGIEMQGLKDDSKMSDHGRVKEIMRHLSPGYEYLDKNFGRLYGHQNSLVALFKRWIPFKK